MLLDGCYWMDVIQGMLQNVIAQILAGQRWILGDGCYRVAGRGEDIRLAGYFCQPMWFSTALN